MAQINWMKYGTIALIVIFAIEIIAFLFTQNPYQGAVATPTPTATLQPEAFVGFNQTSAKVLGIGKQLLVICNTSTDVQPIVNAIPGVSSASFDPANTRFSVSVSSNASTDAVLKDLTGAIKPYCSATVYKRAFLGMDGLLNLTNREGSKSVLLSASNLICLQQSTSAPCFAFVSPKTKENATIDVVIAVRMLGDSVEEVTAEEVQQQQPFEVKVGYGAGKITGYQPDAKLQAVIPWEKRNIFDEKRMEEQLNGTVNFTNLNYVEQTTVEVNGTSEELLGKIKNLSIVIGARIADNRTSVYVKANTSAAKVYSELAKLGVEKSKINFLDSPLEFGFVYDEASEKLIRKVLGGYEMNLTRTTIVTLDNATAFESAMEIALPGDRYALVTGNYSLNRSVPVRLTAFVQGGEVLQAFISEGTVPSK